MKHSRTQGILLVLVCVVAIVILSPFFQPGFLITDDGEWMIIRLSAFYQSLAEGQFPVRMLGRLNHSYGYPVANFLYPGFLYIGSLIHLAGPSFVDSVKIILAGSVIFTAIFLYGWLRRRYSADASLFGVIGFLGSPYLLYDLYHRGSVGEVVAFVPASMILFGIAIRWYWIIPAAVALLIVSHNTLAMVFAVVFTVLSLARKDVWRIALAAGIGIGLAAFFWIPAFAERGLTIFDSVTISRPELYFIGADNLLLLGLPVLLALGYIIWHQQFRDKFTQFAVVIVLVGYFLSLEVSELVWKIPVFSKFIQFPYRFLALSVLFGPWLLSHTYTMIAPRRRVAYIFVTGCVYIFSVWSMMGSIEHVVRPEGYYVTNEGTTTVHDEYLPRWVAYKPLERAASTVELISGDAIVQMHTINTQTIDMTTRATAPSVMQINKLYYPGWGVTIDGVLVPIDYSDAKGVMKVHIPGGVHRVVATFREPVGRFVADLVSLGSGIAYVYYLWTKKYRI